MSSPISGGSNPPSPPSVSGSYQGQGDDGSVDKDNDEEHTDEGVVVLTEGHDDVENGTAPAAPTAPTSSTSTDAETLAEAKQLLDLGVLSQDEFDEMRNAYVSKVKSKLSSKN